MNRSPGARSRLLERPEQRRQRPLTLISALAGYGKTILVSRLIQDKGGNDLASFLDNIPGALSLRR